MPILHTIITTTTTLHDIQTHTHTHCKQSAPHEWYHGLPWHCPRHHQFPRERSEVKKKTNHSGAAIVNLNLLRRWSRATGVRTVRRRKRKSLSMIFYAPTQRRKSFRMIIYAPNQWRKCLSWNFYISPNRRKQKLSMFLHTPLGRKMKNPSMLLYAIPTKWENIRRMN